MLLSKLGAMSIGPLWVLRSNAGTQSGKMDASACCPVCGQGWIESVGQDPTVLVVLPAPITDPAQALLLKNCLKAAGWMDAGCVVLHVDCAADTGNALQVLQTQIESDGPDTVIVFGHQAARSISAELLPGQINACFGTRFVVTLHPEELIRDPLLKARLWADLCLAKSAAVLHPRDEPA